jgi:hypothetical protein
MDGDYEGRERGWEIGYRNELFYGGLAAGKEDLPGAGQDEEDTERAREGYDSAGFDDGLPCSEVHFLFLGGHADLRPNKGGDSAGDQEKSDYGDGVKLHFGNLWRLRICALIQFTLMGAKVARL